MKKIISLIIIAAMIFATLPVFAEADSTVTIAYVKDGETYTAGSAVILGAETNTKVDVARVDFYANDIKIPGCITSLENTLSWTIPTSGSYEIYAKLTTTLGGSYESEKITVYGEPAEKPFLKFDTADDVAKIYGANYALETIPKANANSEYVKKSNFSAPFGPMKTDADRYFTIKGLNVNIGTADPVYLNYLMYASNDIVLRSTLTDYVRAGKTDVTAPDNDHTRPNSDNTANGFIPLKAGWNMLSVSVRENISNGYFAVGAVIDNINEIGFTTYQSNKTIPSDPALYGENAGKKLNEQTNIENTVVYLDSAWVSSAPMAAPKAVSSIPIGATKVCNGLDKMTFTFDKEMELSALSDGDVTVTDENGAAVDNFTLVPSTNALIVDFGENALSYDKTYTVTLSENIKDFYGKSVDSSTREFTFETINSGCEGVEPIASFTYPAANATVASDNVTLAAKVIFGGTVSKVEFFDENDTSLGEGTQGANGEWYLALADGALFAGTHTVYAVVTYGDDNATKVTNGASFEVVEALNYSFTGISAGEEITLNTTAQPLVSRTVGITPAVGVSKVVYKLNGDVKATVTEAPFTWDMPITAVNTDVTLSADVYSVGVIQANPVTYKAIYVEAATTDRLKDDFESQTPSTTVSATGSFSTVHNRSGAYAYTYVSAEDEKLGRDGVVLKIDRNESYSTQSQSLLATAAYPVTDKDTTLGSGDVNNKLRYCFDFYLPAAANGTITLRNVQWATWTDMEILNLSNFKPGVWYSVVAYLDAHADLVTTNVGNNTYFDTFVQRALDGDTWGDPLQYGESKSAIYFASDSDMYIDNIQITRVLDSTRADLFVNGIKKDTAASGETVNVSVANLSSNPASVSVIFALYDDNNELVAVWTDENVNVGANEFSQTTQNVPYTVNGKTGTTVKAFCWNNMNAITPIKSIR